MKNGKLRVVSGCSGIGGIDLGLKWTRAFRTVYYIERERYCQAVLLKQMRKGNLDTAPIWDDFKTFDGGQWRGAVDLFAAGIPCQPHSIAGRGAGAADERNLWPDMARITREMEPRFVLVENVPGLFARERPYGLEVIGELQAMGYLVFKFNLSAAAVGANHNRDRIFILGVQVADAKQFERIQRKSQEFTDEAWEHAQCEPVQGCENVANSDCSSTEHKIQTRWNLSTGGSWWSVEPDVGRVVDGIPGQLDRIRALGNAVVPQVAYEVGKLILEFS